MLDSYFFLRMDGVSNHNSDDVVSTGFAQNEQKTTSKMHENKIKRATF